MTTIMNKTKKSITVLLCVLLALCMGLIGAVQIYAESQTVEYLSDIKFFYSDTNSDGSGSKAKEKCEKEGYTFLNSNLNAGTKMSTSVYLGYKTTTNKDLAITDIRMLGMNRDYYMYDYEEILDYMRKSNVGTAQTLAQAASQFAANYKAGSPKAKDAYEGLNMFYVDDPNVKFGDFILKGKADVDFFTKFVVKTSGGTLSAVMVFLNAGIAPFENATAVAADNNKLILASDNATAADAAEETATEAETTEEASAAEEEATEAEATETTSETATQAATQTAETQAVTVTWAEELAENPLWDTINGDITTAEKSDLHKQYNDQAKEVFAQLQDFTTGYENAIARNPKYEEGDVEESLNSKKTTTAEEAVEELENVELEDCDSLYLAAYDMFNKYNISEDKKLGDWLIEMGNQTSENVDILQLYPLIDTMGSAQAGLVSKAGFLCASNNLGANEHSEEMTKTVEETKEKIRAYNNQDCISVWENADDEVENAHIAYTNDAVRKANASNSIGRKTKQELMDEKFTEISEWINLVSGICLVACYVVQMAFTVASATLAVSAACETASAVCAACAAGVGVVSSALCILGIVVLVVTICYFIAKWVMSVMKKLYPTIDHTIFPDFVFDAVDTANGTLTVKYKSVRDENGEVGDLNGRRQSNWALLAYTTDPEIGSPIRADDAGNIFMVKTGNSAVQNGYACVSLFGERNPANVNYQTTYNNVHGIYISYRTEQSIKNEVPVSTPSETQETSDTTADETEQTDDTQQTQTTETTNYISDIIVVTAGSASDAKAKITKKAGNYYLVDYNMSPNTGIATYIGYTMTTKPEEALTDIRVAPYHGNENMMYGDAQYTFVGHVGVDVGAESNETQGDALMKTKDASAGSPIPADGIHFVTEFKDAEAGWEPVTLFCGLPYDFNTKYEGFKEGEHTHAVSGYTISKSNDWGSHKSVYMYYEPSVKYTSGEKYLAGVYFINGYDISKTIKMLWAQTKANMNQLKDWAKAYPNAALYDRNLAEYVECTMGSGNNYLSQYLVYTYTYNPKRAIYDIVTFGGDTYNDSLPYSLSKKNDETGSTLNYAACSVMDQQQLDGSPEMKVTRFINQNNAIQDSKAGLVPLSDTESIDDSNGILNGYTKTFPEGFTYGYTKSRFIPLGMYVSGVSAGKNPLRISDIVLTENRHDGVEKNGEITFDVSGEKTLDGADATGAFRSVYEIKNSYSLHAQNIAYPQWYNSNNKQYKDWPAFMYIRGAKKSKAKYITSVCVGSFSREQYKASLQTNKSSVKDSDVNIIDSSVNMIAMQQAACGGADEMICYNLCGNQSDAWYNRQSGGKANSSAPGNCPAAYIGVTRTDKASKAITGLLLYQNNDTVTANKIKIDGADYYCDSPSSPIIMNGKQYYLYYTRNKGVLTGSPIEEIIADTNPMTDGYMTALNARVGEDTAYGNSDLTSYIHLKCSAFEGAFYTELFIGKGSNSNAAKSELVKQECYQYIDMDLNFGTRGDTVYLGYTQGALDVDADEEDIEEAWEEAIWDIIVTKGQPYQPDGFVNELNNIYYVPVANVDLNSYGSLYGEADDLYMYYCTPYTSARYNRAQKKAKTGIVTALPEEVFSAPISKLAFARYDRVPYNSSLVGTNPTGNEMMKWEYIMYSDHTAPADFTVGSGELNDSGYFEDNRITMFAQRADGSVKPAGEITGGFVADTMNVGTLTLN